MLQDEVSFVLAEQQENIFSEPLQVAFTEQPNIKDVLTFQRRLITRVRKRRQLYDAKHELFRDIESKEKIWSKIATSLNTDVQKCKNTWAELRYEYQCYVRRLRKYLLYKNTQRKRRPIMALESELLFLWRFIPQQSYASRPFVKLNSKETTSIDIDDDDDVVMLEDEDPVVIILDDEDKNTTTPSPTYKITAEMRKLLDLIKDYKELYDPNNPFFNDYRRKGIIWAGIANESRDKATKLMKLWIQLQTRFEWELMKNKSPIIDEENDIRHIMKFLRPYILENPNTVYKQSTYLKHLWHEPIDHFKNIYNLVATLKRYPKVVRETEKELTAPIKSPVYTMYWADIARYRAEATAGQYEITWLILRFFYWELMTMRKSSYQLQDKWYFENIITDLYETVKKIMPPPPPPPVVNTSTLVGGIPSSTTITQKLPTLPTVSLPLMNPITSAVFSTANATISNPKNDSISTPATHLGTQNFILPKIVSAKSLAVPVTTTSSSTASKSLQITPVMPANAMTVVPTNGFSYNRPQGNNGYMTIPQRPIAMPKTINIPKPTIIQRTPAPNQIQPTITMQQPQLQPTITMQQPQLQPTITMQQPQLQPQPILPTPPLTTPPPPLPQLSGPYSLPKIASVHTMASTPNVTSNFSAPITSSVVTNGGNLVQKKLPVLRPLKAKALGIQPQLPAVLTPKTMPPSLTILPQTSSIPQVSQFQQITSSMPSIASPLITSTIATQSSLPLSQPLDSTSIRPVSEANTQPNVIDLSNLEIPASVIPNPSYDHTKVTNTGPLEVPNALNVNEILIELIASPNGNELFVHGPPLDNNFTMTMEQTAAFIREVMAFPLLHNKTHTKGARVQAYWAFLASKFNMPAHVCRAVWNFLSENFNHFTKIAPMEELMKPFKTEAKPWRIGTALFNRFLDNFIKKGWFKYEYQLPLALEKIGNQRCLYQDLTRGTKVQMNSKKIAEIWKKLREEYNIEEIEDIWTAFKGGFWQYMHDLETGLVNHWPQRLWRCFSKLDFLIRHRYHTMEPYYYIVRNKFNEEVERCSELESKGSAQFSSNTLNKPQSYEIDPYNLLAAVRRYSDTYLLSTMAQKETAWMNVAKDLNTNVSACRLAFQRALKNYRIYMIRDPANRCRLNHRYYKNMHTIYRSVTTAQKISIKTPSELNQSVGDSHELSDIVFPERMIFDINMDNCSPTLVVKNWAYGIGNCTPAIQSTLPAKIHSLFEKYKKFASLNTREG